MNEAARGRSSRPQNRWRLSPVGGTSDVVLSPMLGILSGSCGGAMMYCRFLRPCTGFGARTSHAPLACTQCGKSQVAFVINFTAADAFRRILASSLFALADSAKDRTYVVRCGCGSVSSNGRGRIYRRCSCHIGLEREPRPRLRTPPLLCVVAVLTFTHKA